MEVDPRACGAGEGSHCCAYLAVGGAGFFCGRETELRPLIEQRVLEGTMRATRLPTLSYPACQGQP